MIFRKVWAGLKGMRETLDQAEHTRHFPTPQDMPQQTRTTPPSPEDTLMAQAQLRLAWHIIDEALAKPDIEHALATLEPATVALAKVRELDPHVEVEVMRGPKNNEPVTHTHDSTSAHMLYFESKWLTIQADHKLKQTIEFATDTYTVKQLRREVEEINERARAAAQKAVHHDPSRVDYLLQLAYYSKDPERTNLIRSAQALEPYNVEVLKVANTLKT